MNGDCAARPSAPALVGSPGSAASRQEVKPTSLAARGTRLPTGTTHATCSPYSVDPVVGLEPTPTIPTPTGHDQQPIPDSESQTYSDVARPTTSAATVHI